MVLYSILYIYTPSSHIKRVHLTFPEFDKQILAVLHSYNKINRLLLCCVNIRIHELRVIFICHRKVHLKSLRFGDIPS